MSSSAIPPIDQALLPADIRHGNAAAKSAYQQGLAFEQVLVSQLAQQLASGLDATTAAGGGSDATADGAGGSSSGSDPLSAFSQLLPSALTTSVMSGGGLGVAAQLAAAIDPALQDRPAS